MHNKVVIPAKEGIQLQGPAYNDQLPFFTGMTEIAAFQLFDLTKR
jgi:hypothetical protein